MINDLLLMSLVIFVPTLFALPLVLFPRGSEEGMRWWTLLGTAVTLVFTLFLFIDFLGLLDQYDKTGNREETLLWARADQAILAAAADKPADSRDLVGRVRWIDRFNIDYYLGVDGISMSLVLMTAVLSLLAMVASWKIEKNVKGYCMLFLLLETGMLGTFMALDFFLFFVFWEIMLLPMYFLIGIWGGPRREYAAIKFFLYTLLGSVCILIAILAFYFTDLTPMVNRLAKEQPQAADTKVLQAVAKPMTAARQPVNTFDLMVLQKAARDSTIWEAKLQKAEEAVARSSEAGKPDPKAQAELEALRKEAERSQPFKHTFQIIMFILLMIGFAIKVPVFPFHTWLPDAHVEAPTPISMILAGVLLKLGGYGIIRIAYPLCPWAAYELAWWVSLFGIINIVYGALAAMAQTDFKKLVAYSSISHMGYVILGVAVWTSADRFQYWGWGMNGAMFQMIAHGITSAGMFFLVGVIYDRIHHRDLNAMGGLNNIMPFYAGVSAIIFFGAMGLPGLCGFVGEFFTVLGAWNYSRIFSVLAAVTVVLTAAYILWTVQRVYLGGSEKYKGLPEMDLRETACILPLVVLAILLGVWPASVLEWMEPSVTGLVKNLATAIPG